MKKTFRLITALIVIALLAIAVSAQENTEGALTLNVLGTYETDIFDEGAQEIGVYDATTQRLFVTNADANRIDVLDLSNPSQITLVSEITLDEYGDSINSVAVSGDVVAAAVEAEDIDANGQVVFLNTDGEVLAAVTVGVLPDMVTFTPDSSFALSANEGEPNDEYSIDPPGSVSIIEIPDDITTITDEAVTTLGFEAFNADGERADELPDTVRIFGPEATVAQDLEPEYVAAPDSMTAFVALQENNAIAVIDIQNREIVRIIGLGTKDYSLPENAIDPSNEDDGINIRTVPAVGMYQPDAIAAYTVDEVRYIVTANEGDARDYDTFTEEFRVGDDEIVLDEEAFPNADDLKDEANLGRLRVTNQTGDTDGDGDIDVLHSYGARSFSIWTAEGELVFDSASQFEDITAAALPEAFNSNGTVGSFDDRSDDKGPEPEGVTIGMVGNSTYAFIGLERIGGVMVYDITAPANASYVTYVNNSNPQGNPEEGTAGDIGPEGLVFISAEDSPVDTPLLVVTNEVSGSTTVYEIVQN